MSLQDWQEQQRDLKRRARDEEIAHLKPFMLQHIAGECDAVDYIVGQLDNPARTDDRDLLETRLGEILASARRRAPVQVNPDTP